MATRFSLAAGNKVSLLPSEFDTPPSAPNSSEEKETIDLLRRF
jgi:hypothetical protein